MTLPEAVQQVLPPDDNMRIGTVVSVYPLVVDIEGTLAPVGCLSSYGPIIGDAVALLRQDSTWLALGRPTSPRTGRYPQFQAGTVDMTAAAAASVVTAVVFAVPFATVPSVATNINSGSGAVAGWGSRAISVGTTGFNLFIFGAANTFTVPVQWQAQEMTQ